MTATMSDTPPAGTEAVSRHPLLELEQVSRVYGEEIEVALIAFLRPERRFAGVDALRAQIAADAAEARRVLDLAVPPSA